MALLDATEVAEFCERAPQWESQGDRLVSSVEAPSFLGAIAWVDAIALIAEELDHHPDIDIRWRTLHFILSTHSDGGITQLDLQLATRIDEVVGQVET